MRHVSKLVGTLAIVALALAPLGSAFAGEGKKTHDVTVTVVSLDEKGKTITFTTETGEQKTAPVMGQAIAKLKSLKTGEKVTLTCTDKADGQHEGVSDIHAAPAATAQK